MKTKQEILSEIESYVRDYVAPINPKGYVPKKEKKDLEQWRFNYFGKDDAINIENLEKGGAENPETFWCVAMAIKYINLLCGMNETKELKKINSYLKSLEISQSKTKKIKRVG